MSAEDLREAARSIKSDDCASDLEWAVADWLEAVAERQKPTERYNRRSHGWTGSRQANAVARAILRRDP